MFALIFRLALASMRQNLVARAVAVAAMAGILACAGAMFQVVGGFSKVLEDIRSARWMTAYLSPSVSESQEAGVLSGIRKIPGVQSAQLISKDAFLSNFQKYFPSFAKGLADLEVDAIPRFIKVRADDGVLEQIRKSVSENRAIEQVEMNETRFSGLIRVISGLRNFCLALLAGVALAGIGLIAHQSRQRNRFQEQLAKTLRDLGAGRLLRLLPGAVEGCIEGFGAGLIAALALGYSSRLIDKSVAQLFGAMGYESYPASPHGFAAAVLMIGFFSGMIGSVWAQLRPKS